MITTGELMAYIDGFAPFSSAAEWDNSGLQLGDPDAAAARVLLSLDVTPEEVYQAERDSCKLILSHHPLLFRGLKQIPADSVPAMLIRNGVSVISAHTNLDKATGGVNDSLCETLGFPYEKCGEEIADGFLNVSSVITNAPMSASDFASRLSERLHASVRYISCGRPVFRIGVCCGAGDDFVREAAALGCDAFLTGDASYHAFLDAKELGVTLFAAGHFETEAVVLPVLQRRLSAAFPGVDFIVSERKSPVQTVMLWQ